MTEEAMLKHLSIFAAIVVLAAGSAKAQQSDPVWQKVEVPGADFVVVFATTTNPVAANNSLRASPDPLVVYPAGSELAFAVDGEVEKLFKDVGAVQFPACAFRVERKGSKPIAAIAYVLPKEEETLAAQAR
jgi:hypothetical protein